MPRKPNTKSRTKPVQPTQKIVDEMCTCDHVKSRHDPRFAAGHGPCSVKGCGCHQFTWSRFIYEGQS
jgi:hypothetical protein